MSIQLDIAICCDNQFCDNKVTGSGYKASELRARARKMGWLLRGKPVRDYCDTCALMIKRGIRPGVKVRHHYFGDGKVLRVCNGVVSIAFNRLYGVQEMFCSAAASRLNVKVLS